MNSKTEKLIQDFSKFNNWEEKYKYIIKLGRDLKPLDKEYKTENLLVKGCQSQVWLRAFLNDEGKVCFQGESDSVIVQGLLSILIFVYSGEEPDFILKTSPDFLKKLELEKHLSPNRTNGVYAMIKQIKYYAQAMKLLALSNTKSRK